jgi:predicted nuclease with TOPRIM domain
LTSSLSVAIYLNYCGALEDIKTAFQDIIAPRIAALEGKIEAVEVRVESLHRDFASLRTEFQSLRNEFYSLRNEKEERAQKTTL